MKLPNGENAVVELRKLRDYCLDTNHPRGRHKAKVFITALGITREHAEHLRGALRLAAGSEEARMVRKDEYGERYVIESWVEGPRGRGRVRSSWIIRTGEDFPRLVSCHVL